jgi:ribonuclease P protein component
MLSKTNRLPRRDFIFTKFHGKSYSSKNFSAVVFSPTTNNLQLITKFSVVTSLKISKSAVVRNSLRRRIYQQLTTYNLQLNLNVIFYPRASMLNLTHDQIGTEINSFLSNLPPQTG